MRRKSDVVREKVKLQPRRVAARWSAFLGVVSGVVAYNLSYSAYDNPHVTLYGSGTNFVVQNWGVAFIFLEAVFFILLAFMQKGVYWFWWLQTGDAKWDERQVAVRQRVFVRSYGIAVIFMILFLPGLVMDLLHLAEPAASELATRMAWIGGLFFVALPSILAAWQKDS